MFSLCFLNLVELPFPSIEQLEQAKNFLLKYADENSNEEIEPFSARDSLNVTDISEKINELFDGVTNASQPIYESEILLVIPETSIIPIA